jgi:hypothetical protein|tara:strand:+ start:165 stop:719 length:555 start_codon:yes stop_codon:yes gene_type:complete
MIQEFICPNGRMSVNGVCPIFEGDDGQIKDIKNKKTSTYDAMKEDEIFEEDKGVFEFDFEKPTESAFESADNIISSNIKTYQNFVEDKLGISPQIQTLGTFGSMAFGLSQGGGALSVLGPLAIPFIGGAIINQNKNQNETDRIQTITDQDTQGDINIIDFQNTPTKTYSAPQQTSGPGGLHSNY